MTDPEFDEARRNKASLEFIAQFERERGRPLRVLHIGNIANNAYNNAKIQRRHGIEADVICYDYYHVMGCPEWEDAEFSEDVDQFFPDWWSTSLGGWARPRWFAQGPAHVCIQYLRARALKCDVAADLLWGELQARQRRLVAIQLDPTKEITLPKELLEVESKVRREELLSNHFPTERSKATLAQSVRGHRPQIYRALPASLQKARIYWLDLLRFIRGIEVELLVLFLRRKIAITRRILEGSRWRDAFRSLLARYTDRLRELLIKRAKFRERVSGLGYSAIKVVKHWTRSGESRTAGLPFLVSEAVFRSKEGLIERRRQKVLNDSKQFPNAEYQLIVSYLVTHAPRFFDLLQHYDVVQGYSIDGFLAHINGFDNYTAYEHGTLRDIPFEQTLNGGICRAAYKNAQFSFVTNSDVLPSVDRLGLEPEKVVYLPHAFDDSKPREFLAANSGIAPPSEKVVFFCPARQHWQDKSGSWTKGNDVYLRAAALLAEEGHDFELLLVEWGKEIDQSRALIESLELSSFARWIPPLKKKELWSQYLASHAIIDQFGMPVIGGVAFEAMALGRRIITWLDDATMTTFFGKEPPCLNACNVEQCFEQMRNVVLDPLDVAGRGQAAKHWMATFHSSERIVALQVAAYRSILTAKQGINEEKRR